MKKFLPLILFIMVFVGVVAWQVAANKFINKTITETPQEYKDYEALFLNEKLSTTEGKAFDLKEVKTPIVIVNFWASWCIPCLDEMPSMLSLKKSFANDQISIVAINTDEDEQLKNINKIKQKIKINDEFIIVPDKEGNLTGKFKISAIPVSIVFLHGKVVHVSNGPMDFHSEEFKEKMKGWLL